MPPQLMNYLINIILQRNDAKVAATQLQQFGMATDKSSQSAKKATPVIDEYIKALKRVAIVVPVWMAARAAIRAMTTTIRESFQFIAELDAGLARAQATMSSFTGDIDEFRERLKLTARALAVETGESIKDVTESFYRFSTAGIAAETSLKGMEIAVKTAVGLMGDTEEIAKTLAQTYNLLGRNMDSTLPEWKKIQVIAGTISTLFQDNQFELNEFSQGLERFGTAASNMGISVRDSIALLATMHQQGIRGARAGRLLSRAFDQLASKSSVLRQELGIVVSDTSPIDWFELFTATLRKFDEAGTQAPATVRSIIDIFNIIGARGVRALTANMEKFADNINLARRDADQLIETLTEMFELQMGTVNRQMGRFRNLVRETGRAFILGVTGTDDMARALEKINERMVELTGQAHVIGLQFREWGENINWSARQASKFLDEILGGFAKATTGALPQTFDIPGLPTPIQISRRAGFLTSDVGKVYQGILKELQQNVAVGNQEILKELALAAAQGKIAFYGPEAIREDQSRIEKIKGRVGKTIRDISDFLGFQPEENAAVFAKKLGIDEREFPKIMQRAMAAGLQAMEDESTKFDPLPESLGETAGVVFSDFTEQYKRIIAEVTGEAVKVEDERQQRISELNEKIKDQFQETEGGLSQLSRANIDAKIRQIELARQYWELEQQGVNSAIIAQQKLADLVNQIASRRLETVEGTPVSVDEQALLADALNRNWDSIIEKVDQGIISEEELFDIVSATNEVFKERVNLSAEFTEKYLDALSILGHSDLEIEQERLRLMQERGFALEAIREQEERIHLLRLQEVREFAEEFEGSFQSALANVLKGEATITDFFESLRLKLRDMWAEALSEMITTNLFRNLPIGNVLGGQLAGVRGLGSGVTEASRQGAQFYYDAITRASQQGADNLSQGIQSGAAAVQPTQAVPAGAGGGLGGGLFGGLGSLFGGGAGGGGAVGGGFGFGNIGFGGLISAGATAMIASQGGGGSPGLAFVGSLLASTGNPILGVLGGLLSLFGLGSATPPSWTRTETRETTRQVTSRIDVTNKQLEIVNRNLVSLRQDLTFILPQSAAFSEARNLADQFSLNARRGIT